MKSKWQNQNYVHIYYKENAIHQIVHLFMVYYVKHVVYTAWYPIFQNKMKNIEKVCTSWVALRVVRDPSNCSDRFSLWVTTTYILGSEAALRWVQLRNLDC